MSINYPTSLDSIPNPTSTDLLENATTALDHDQQHANANDAIEALEAKVGANSSAVTTSHDYKLGEVISSDKAVGKTATQTMTNKTLTAPQINFGSDARGDLMVRNSSGVTSRLASGSSGQILQTNASGDPEWTTNPAVTNASSTVKGSVELATTAEINAGTATGGTGAALVVTPDQLLAANYLKTSLYDYQVFTSNGTWTKPSGVGSTQLVIVQVWGGGGAGGGATTGSNGTGGGGGGAYLEGKFRVSDLSSTEAVTVGAAVAGGTGLGTNGNSSSFGTHLVAYGGGGGGNSDGSNSGSGGGGGGVFGAGVQGTKGNPAGGAVGGAPLGAAAKVASTFGGGGGADSNAGPAGNSVFGGGGGGGGGGDNGGNSIYGGGGGGGAAVGTGGTSFNGGNGGSGGSSAGVDGTAPGGGGGGTSGVHTSGGGARGEVRVFVLI